MILTFHVQGQITSDRTMMKLQFCLSYIASKENNTQVTYHSGSTLGSTPSKHGCADCTAQTTSVLGINTSYSC
jgi:hypothetical protein